MQHIVISQPNKRCGIPVLDIPVTCEQHAARFITHKLIPLIEKDPIVGQQQERKIFAADTGLPVSQRPAYNLNS